MADRHRGRPGDRAGVVHDGRLRAYHERLTAKTLRDGLQSNREIGKAVGLLMAFHQISDDAAFDMLRKASQDMNIKLAEVARQVVEHHREA